MTARAVPGARSARATGAGILVTAWGVAVAASWFGSSAHELTPNLVTAFLLWRIWRGATWTRYVLTALSCLAAGIAGGVALGIALGATGVVISSLVMFALYAVVGALVCTPPVRRLSRSSSSTALA
jgi:hypothetical protein